MDAEKLAPARGIFRGVIGGLLLWLFICGTLSLIHDRLEATEESCPDGQVKYDAVLGEFVYGEYPSPNAYGVYVDQIGNMTQWTPRLGCCHCAICIATEGGLEWRIDPPAFGTAYFANHIIWWGACQVPCQYPPECLVERSYIPLSMK